MSSHRDTPSGSLAFRRPAPRGRLSTSNLREQSSKASMRTTHMLDDNDDADSDTGGETTFDASMSVSSPIPANGSHFRGPQSDAQSLASSHALRASVQEPITIEGTASAIDKLIEDAHSGSFAVGALGQTLLDQQMQLRSLLDSLQAEDHSAAGAQELAKAAHAEVEKMREEQQRLVRELLQASKIDLPAREFNFSSPQVETHAFLDSLTAKSPKPDDAAFSSPSKPDSHHARELRRQKTAAASKPSSGATLVDEIEKVLITEIRRLQALLAERDKVLTEKTEILDEAMRIRTLHEQSIKRLESEKDAQDANLYEIERKEDLLREENEEVTRQLKKHENELRILKRQLAEKSDAMEAFKVNNDDLEERMEDMRGNVATLKAKGIADHKTISGLKVQVNDWEAKHRQAIDKIPRSMSIASRVSSNTWDATADSTQTDGRGVDGMVDSPSGRRFAGAHGTALTPTASVDDELTARLRPNEVMKNMKADIAKWRNAAMKYRKKWTETRRQGAHADGRSLEHDDSTDEDEDEGMWQDEVSARDPKRNSYAQSRIVSSNSRRGGKTMGDAFGIGHRIVSGSSLLSHKRESWQSHDALEERSYEDDDGNSSYAGSSVRGSVDGFDPNFGDPTLRGAKANNKRRSTYTPSSANRASPLTRQLDLVDDARSDADASYASHDARGRPDSMVGVPVGALGDELMAVADEPNRAVIDEAEHHAAMERTVAERDAAHDQQVQDLQKVHTETLAERDARHAEELQQLHNGHSEALSSRDAIQAEQVQMLNKDHADALAELARTHASSMDAVLLRHTHSLSARDGDHETQLSKIEQDYEEKLKLLSSRHVKAHDDAMADARQRHSEVLAKQREEAQEALLMAERERKALVEERDRVHSDELNRKVAQHERELRNREKEHQNMLEDVQATHVSFANQRDAAFSLHISQRDQIINEKDEELATLRKRLAALETELNTMRTRVVQAEDKVVATRGELHELQFSSTAAIAAANDELEAEKTAKLALEQAALPSASSQHSHDDFEDASEEEQIDVLTRSTVAIDATTTPLSVAKHENSSQTESVVLADSTSQTEKEAANVADLTIPLSIEQHQETSKITRKDAVTEVPRESTAAGKTILPALPSMPPPPTLSSLLARSNSARNPVPGRPTSPPPTGLLARSSQGETDARLGVPSNSGDSTSRPSSRLANGPPPSAFLQQGGPRRSNTPSLRMHDGQRAEMVSSDRASMSSRTRQHPMRAPSAQSFVSDATSDMMSGRTSRTSNYMVDDDYRRGTPGPMSRRQSVVGGSGAPLSTDPVVLGAITQTMIGEYLYKYTRRSMGRSNVRHKRFFWVHPYNRTLFWTTQGPGEAVSNEGMNKSAFIQDVMVVEDTSVQPADLFHLSIVVNTLKRDVKFTAQNREQHNRWITALGYLVNREMPTESRPVPSEWRQSISRASLPRSQHGRASSGAPFSSKAAMTPASMRGPSAGPQLSPSKSASAFIQRPASQMDTERTPRARGASMGRPSSSLLYRKDTAAREYLEQYEAMRGEKGYHSVDVDASTPRAGATSSMSRRSGRGSLAREMFGGMGRGGNGSSNGHPTPTTTSDPRQHMTAEQMLAEDEERAGETFDGLANVRACCDGKHDVGALAHKSSRPRTGGAAMRARSSTPSLLQRTTRGGSKATEASSNDAPPQLGPLSINSLGDGASQGGIDRTLTAAGVKGSTDSAEFHSATEFGGLSGRATPASELGSTGRAGTSLSKHMNSGSVNGRESAPLTSSFIDRVTQIRRNKASSASIR